MATVVFLHGLNTYADGLVHMGPLTFGRMSDSWNREITGRGWKFVDVSGMGFGPVEEQADQAMASLEKSGVLASDESLHLLGHSMGGLVARVVSHRPELKNRIKTIMTVGTPHGGAEITEMALALETHSPGLYRFMKTFGYDVVKKRASLSHFTTARLLEIHNHYRDVPGIRAVSFIGNATYDQLCLPYQVIYSRLHPKGRAVASDGFIASESQKWGEVRGEFALDHLAEIGVYLNVSPAKRKQAHREFLRLAEAAATVISESK